MKNLHHRAEEQRDIDWMLQSSQVDDEQLLEALVVAYGARLLHLSAAILSQEQGAHNPVRESVLALVKNRHRYNGEQRLLVWLLRATNRNAQPQSAQIRTKRYLDKLYAPASPASAEPDVPEDVSLLETARLTNPDKTLLLLRYLFGLTLEEIGFVVQSSVREVHLRLVQARNLVKQSPETLQRIEKDLSPAEHGFLASHFAEPETEDEPHASIRLQCQAAVDGILEVEPEAQMEAHFYNCAACERYSKALAYFDKALLRHIGEYEAVPELSAAEHQQLLGGLSGSSVSRKRLAFRMREFALGLSAVLLIFFSGWFGRVAQAEPQATVIVMATHMVQGRSGRVSTPVPELENIPQTGKDSPGRSRSALPRRTLLELAVEEVSLPSAPQTSANLSGILNISAVSSYWGNPLNTDSLLAHFVLAPHTEISPRDLIRIVERRRGLNALYLTQGNTIQLKQLVAEGFPVIIQRGMRGGDGHMQEWFETLHGYDDAYGVFWSFSISLSGRDTIYRRYDEFVDGWKAYDSAYLVVYPDYLEKELLSLIEIQAVGPQHTHRVY